MSLPFLRACTSSPFTVAVTRTSLDGMGMAASRPLVEGAFILVGIIALLLSVALGAAAWGTALRLKIKTSGGVFARGFLGISAVIAFLIGVAWVALGIGRQLSKQWSDPAANATLIAAVTLGVVFLAVEFAIAGTLYGRVAKTAGGTWPKLLSIGSYGLSAALALVSLLGFVAALGSLFAS
ncbi:MAG: hypothetical protein DRI90_25690 [Deltaproteobacteria bacterium]|nr:MAG: hypothetical protein DRI90_25690 [Deltaproteobacteria bacterium]